jgi:ABC-type multidrug transport system fused ATPase/permease subunit
MSIKELSVQKKIWKILNQKQKIHVWYLLILLFIGMLFEMLSVGILIPALGLFFNPNQNYPFISNILIKFGNPSSTTIVCYGMAMLVLIYFIKTIFLIFLSWKQSTFIVNLSTNLSKKMFSGYLNQPYSFHLQKNSSELGSYVIGEVGLLSNVLLAIVNLILEITAIIGIAVILFFAEPVGSLFVITFLLLFSFLFHRITRKKLLYWGQTRQKYQVQVSKNLFQGLNGIKDILILNKVSFFEDIFNFNLFQSSKNQIKVNTLNLIPRLYLEFLSILCLAGLIIFMVINKKPIENLIPTLGVFVAAAFRMIPSANRIIASIQQIKYNQPAVNLVFKEFSFLNNNSIVTNTNKINFNLSSKFEIKNIDFKYEGQNKNILNNVTFEFHKGDYVGIIGTSGSGKSTLVDILLGLLKPDNGQVLIDGHNIFDDIKSWQMKIGYVPQVIYLTDDTLLRNIAFGVEDKDIDFEALTKAINGAQLTEFINNLENKLETEVGERGVRLSGGQRQRIGIARALYNDPEILVLDEATSALDINTEVEVMKAINTLKRKKTLIVISHRLSTLNNCDLIIKLENGSIIN